MPEGKRPTPDTRVVAFPENWRADSSPGAAHATWGPDHSTPPLRVPAVVASNFRRLDKNTLIGTVDLTVPRWKMRFRACLWYQKGSKEWVAFAAREWTDREGNKQYAVLNEFTDRDTHDRFRRAALAAIHAVAGSG